MTRATIPPDAGATYSESKIDTRCFTWNSENSYCSTWNRRHMFHVEQILVSRTVFHVEHRVFCGHFELLEPISSTRRSELGILILGFQEKSEFCETLAPSSSPIQKMTSPSALKCRPDQFKNSWWIPKALETTKSNGAEGSGKSSIRPRKMSIWRSCSVRTTSARNVAFF